MIQINHTVLTYPSGSVKETSKIVWSITDPTDSNKLLLAVETTRW